MKDSLFYTKHTLNISGTPLLLDTPIVMGILNVTPDSFYKKGRISDEGHLIETAQNMLTEGAKILDVGGYSSRPGAIDISEEEETARVLPAIKRLSKEFPDALISVDTFRSGVAIKAIDAGAKMINDISAGELDSNMFQTVSKLKVPYIAMHLKGTPQNMTTHAQYKNILHELIQYFQAKLVELRTLGVHDVIIDPGFGFAKTKEQSLYLLNKLETFKILNVPILAGLSRKSLIYKTLNINQEMALNGTTVLNTCAILKGASILRVHDVKEAVEIVKLTSEMQKGIVQ